MPTRPSRSATITTFEPLLDTTYIPCVSLLDFWIRDGQLEAIVYAHSIDFGSKGYGNLVELAFLMERVAEGLGLPVGRLDFVVKSGAQSTSRTWRRCGTPSAPWPHEQRPRESRATARIPILTHGGRPPSRSRDPR